jgi:hypothetical protein
MSKLEHALSASALAIILLLLAVTCAFARGYADGASLHHRGGCDVDNIKRLNAGWYAQVQRP